jgi:hypothetical protein
VVVGILALAAGPGVGAVLAVVVVLFCCWIAAWLMTRFSLSYPLTVLRGEFVVFESWSLTGGRFWSLFGAYFVIFVVYFLLATLMSLVTSGSYLLEMMQGGFTSEAMQAAAEHQRAEQMAGVSLPMILSWVLGGLLGGLSIALFGGAAATAARDLTGDVAGVAETFA